MAITRFDAHARTRARPRTRTRSTLKERRFDFPQPKNADQKPKPRANRHPKNPAFAQISQHHASQSADSSPTLATIGPPNRFDT